MTREKNDGPQGRPEFQIFRDYIRKKGLRYTPEREIILREIVNTGDHFDVDELYLRLRNKGERLSKASIYRTIPLLIDCGLIQEVYYEDGHMHYEFIYGHEHHCHLRCLECRRIDEFVEPSLKKIEDRLARKFGYRVVGHKLEVYGYCPECRKKLNLR